MKIIDEQIHAAMAEGLRRVKKKRDSATVFITLGSGNEFGISDGSMFIRMGTNIPIDLGLPTRENFNRLIANMKRLECHLEE